MAMPSATVRSHARPVASCSMANELLMPLPAWKFLRTLVPDPFGATRMTSMFFGGINFVCLR